MREVVSEDFKQMTADKLYPLKDEPWPRHEWQEGMATDLNGGLDDGVIGNSALQKVWRSIQSLTNKRSVGSVVTVKSGCFNLAIGLLWW